MNKALELVEARKISVEFSGGSHRCTVAASEWQDVAKQLYTEGKLDFLYDIVGMDFGEAGLGAIYYLSSSVVESDKMLAVTVLAEEEVIPTVTDLWRSALIYEREVYDYFGIRFKGHPDLRRIFLRTDWVGYPLRKDYNMDPAVNPIPHDAQPLEELEHVPVLNLREGLTEQRVFEEGDYVINFGPQHPSMHGVLHLRVALDGEIVKKIDPHFGYIHRGIEKMSEAYTYPQILHLTERLDYLSGTMNRHAVCLCCENALGIVAPPRALYVRSIVDELTRIASHLLGWGCFCMDMGAITAFIYGMRDREKVLDIFEESGGSRMMPALYGIGGLTKDVHPKFFKQVKEFIPYMRKMLKEYHILFTGNPIARDRMNGVGILSRDLAVAIGATGPASRASGWDNDLRKIAPYAAYDKVDFNVLTRQGGETFDRYLIRLDEIEESLKIIEQLIDNVPEGPYTEKTKAVIRLPEGDFNCRVEGARGQFGVHITSKGDKSPYRVKFRSPCLTLVSALRDIAEGTKVSDLIMIGASLDYVIPCIDR